VFCQEFPAATHASNRSVGRSSDKCFMT
jgi:hypothetical protein